MCAACIFDFFEVDGFSKADGTILAVINLLHVCVTVQQSVHSNHLRFNINHFTLVYCIFSYREIEKVSRKHISRVGHIAVGFHTVWQSSRCCFLCKRWSRMFCQSLFHCAGDGNSEFPNKDQQAPELRWHCTSILTCKYLYSLHTFMTGVES